MATMTNRSETVYDQTTFERQTCIHCGVVFYWPADLDRRARNTARGFWCPGCGKSMVYMETEADRLKKQLEDERTRTEHARKERDRARSSEQIAKRRVVSMKGVVTKTKNRIAAGKCIRCSTQFPDLAEHMAAQHPELGDQ